MSDQRFAVIGLGQFGSAIAKNLSNRGAEVIAIDSSLEKVEGIKDEVSHAVAHGCYRQEGTLVSKHSRCRCRSRSNWRKFPSPTPLHISFN